MNRKARQLVQEIEAPDSKYVVITHVRRPFVVAIVLEKNNTSTRGVGFACVQFPDLWSEVKGKRTALIRAAKDILGIPNPHLDKNILAMVEKDKVWL